MRLGIGELKLRKKGLLPEMQLLAEMHFLTKVISLGTPRTLLPSMTMKTAVSVRRRRRMAKSSTKRSRSKGNSLPLTKRFDFTMVDDDFEESQRGFVSKETNADTKKCMKFFKDSASARNHHSSSTIKMVPNDILLTDTACNSSKSSSTMVLSNPLAGGRLLPLLREHLEDLAILRRLKARYQLQVGNPQQAHSTIQTIRAFSGRLFLVNHLLHTFSGVLRTLLHETRGRVQ